MWKIQLTTVGSFTVVPPTLWLFPRISFSLLNEMGDKERQSQVELDVKSLQILRAIIHNQIMHIDPNLREESPTTFRK